MLAVSSSLSLTPSKYLADRLWSSSLFSHLLPFFHGHCVSFFEQSPTSAVFDYADPCFVGLIAAFDWVFSIFKFLFEEFVDVIFPFFLGLPIALLILYLVLSSGFQSAAFLNYLSLGDVAILSASFHFIFCDSCSSMESLRFPSFPWLHLCFFYVFNPVCFFNRCGINSLRQHRLQMKLHCPRHCDSFCSVRHRFHRYAGSLMSVSSISSLLLISCFSIILYLLFV